MQETKVETGQRADRLVLLVRLCFTPLAILTGIFGAMLMLLPSSTQDYWAWPILPAMSAVWVGAAYTFGAIAITTMLIVGRWRSAIVPVVATWPFAIVMLAATLIHNDRFFTDKAGYYVWFVIYLILPFALPAMFVLNRGQDPGRTGADLLLPLRLRGVLAIAGCIVGLVGIALVLKPTLLDQSWAWQLTPLMSRVIGGWLLFLATGALAALVEPRYEAFRYYFLVATIWFALLLVNSVIHAGDFDFDRASAPLFFAAVTATVVGSISIFVLMEQRLRSGPQQR